MSDLQREAYREEARELLLELETTLLELEKTPRDQELIGRAFRALHTVKGSGAMFGFDNIASFTHHIENAYDRVRDGTLDVSKALIDLTLTACDQIRRMVDESEGTASTDDTQTTAISAKFLDLVSDNGPAAPETADRNTHEQPHVATQASATPACTPAGRITYRITFHPPSHLFASGTNPLLLLKELRELGPCTIVAHTDQIPLLENMDPEQCYTWWDLILTSARGVDAIKDVFIFVEEDSDLKITVIDRVEDGEEAPDYKKVGEILVDKGDISPDDVRTLMGQRKLLGEILVDSGLVTPDTVDAALAEQQHVREMRRQRQAETASASIRVPADKLDALVNMVGELVTVQSRLNQLSSDLNNLALIQVAEEVERLTAGLRDNAMSIRMLPIGTTFKKFARLLRDLGQELGKEVELETMGGDTELDKTVIERLNDPLVHVIRNSIDHGIELPDLRENAGKPRKGTVRLSASHEGTSVRIEVRDDGAGINRDAVRKKAIEAALLSSDASISDKDLLSLIFSPGFSTASKVTSVSGRGVGMDVVKRSIDSLGGTLEVASDEGCGTTLSMKLPLTLAIIDGLLVKIQDTCFVLPLAAIEECIELTRDEVASRNGQNLAFIRGDVIPYIPLRSRFRIEGEPPAIEQIVTTHYNGCRVGLLVDQVVGQHQTVIKSLGGRFESVDEISGATILGDGSVALILDIPKLIRKVELEESWLKRAEGG